MQAWEITCLETMISTNPTGIAIIQVAQLCKRLPNCAKGCPTVQKVAQLCKRLPNCAKGCQTVQKLAHLREIARKVAYNWAKVAPVCEKLSNCVKRCPSARNAVRIKVPKLREKLPNWAKGCLNLRKVLLGMLFVVFFKSRAQLGGGGGGGECASWETSCFDSQNLKFC